MRRSIATVCLSGTLAEKLEAIASARFDAIELFEHDFIHQPASAAEIRQRCDDLGLGIDLYQPMRDIEGVSDAQFRRNLDRAERKFDLMQTLGTSSILVCSNVSPQAIDDDARAAAQLHALAERAAPCGIRIGFEALAWGRHVRHYEHAWRLVQQADHPHLGLVLDSFHLLSLGDDPSGIADIPGERIVFAQIADAPWRAMDVLQWSRHYRCFPGQGQLDLTTFTEQLLLTGYTGPLSLEVFNDQFRAAPARPTAQDAMRSLQYLEEAARQRLATPSGNAERDAARQATAHRLALFAPPPLPPFEGLAFIEFAVDTASEPALAKVLGQLGFVRIGRHRSKAVTLYRQGDIDLILNAEPASFAQQHAQRHGPSICALGIATPDPLRALNRATAFGCPRLEGRVGPNELHLPAVCVPDGSLLYFVPTQGGNKRSFEADFEIDADAATASALPAGASLQAVSHISQGVSALREDAWVLFHRTVLGAEPGTSLELADPYGLIRTRSLATPGRELRFLLTASDSSTTHTARTMAQRAGASLHHVAFTCDDIFATVAALRARGAAFIPVSPNYYEDLPTRLPVSAPLLAQLQAHGVLYDEDAAGAYFHICTTEFAGRFFFEIVQRVGGYDGYGEINSPARMAAHLSGTTAAAEPRR